MNLIRASLYRSAAMLSFAALLSACASVPKLGAKPEMRTPASVAAQQSFASQGSAAWPGDGWWNGYGDAQLGQLIEEGLKGSPDAIAAAARFRTARGLAQVEGARLLPSVDGHASVGVEKQTYYLGFPPEFIPHGWKGTGEADLSFNFDVDLWGRNRAALAAATSEAEAARIEQNEAQLVLTTAIAAAYADLARLYAERDVLAAAVDLRIATQKLVTDRVRIGLDTRAELKQADAAVPTARADLAATDEMIKVTRNQLAALVGAGPDRGLAITRPTLSSFAQPGLPPGVTTDLIGRRPDIAAARARAEAAASRIKVARADFYPAITLKALIGVQAIGLQYLTNSGAIYGNAGPAVTLPIFRGGELSGRYRSARGTYDEAVANYDKTVLTAYREVADALAGQQSIGEQLAQSRQALADSEEAYSVARQRYQGGLSTYLDVLTSEEKLLQARRSVANLGAQQFAIDIALVRALGGGFTTTTDQNAKDHSNG
jgi:NodT family efflux transporter outer membrane factor (OMF) lipoprotein